MEKVTAFEFMKAKAYTGIPIGPSFFSWLIGKGIEKETMEIELWENILDQFYYETRVIS